MGFTVGQQVQVPAREAKIGINPEGESVYGALPTLGKVESVTVQNGRNMILVAHENGTKKYWNEDEVKLAE